LGEPIVKKDLICVFNELLGQLRALHWQTRSYAQHIAFETTYDTIAEHADRFVEVYQGKYGRVKVISQPNLMNIDDDNLKGFINEHIHYFTQECKLKEDDVDLLAIRDEIVAELNKLKYLLTLK
jgi:hypothetical protein